MLEKEKQNLIKQRELLEQQIDDIKLEDIPSYKKIKEMLKEIERINFKLNF
jgi:hypothetical protein